MNKTRKAPTLTHIISRPGEGIGIDVIRQIVPQADGGSIQLAGFDLRSAPVPDRRYTADLAGMLYKNETVKFIFAQETISQIAGTLRSMLIVHMAATAARQFLRSFIDMDSPNLDDLVKISGIEPEPLFKVEVEPEQTIALAANMVAVAIGDREVCLDFYHASAFAIANLSTASKIPVDPVVRVDLRTSLLLSLRKAIQDLEHSFPPDAIPRR